MEEKSLIGDVSTVVGLVLGLLLTAALLAYSKLSAGLLSFTVGFVEAAVCGCMLSVGD